MEIEDNSYAKVMSYIFVATATYLLLTTSIYKKELLLSTLKIRTI